MRSHSVDNVHYEPYHRLRINQNRHYPSEESPLTSVSHADINTSRTSRERWGIKNLETGTRTSNLLTFAFITGVIQKWIQNFQDGDNFLVKILNRLFLTASTVAEGERDKQMYEEIYAMGTERAWSPEEIRNQEELINSQKIIGSDDILENMREQELYGERVVAQTGLLATGAAKIKPVIAAISGLFLTSGQRNLLNTFIDIPARVYWRLRFFSSSLHANFSTTMFDLGKFSFKSLFSANGRTELKEHIKTMEENSREYFHHKYGVEGVPDGKKGLGLYFSMLVDRLKEHKRAKDNPEATLEEKREEGFLVKVNNEARKPNPDRTIDRGYADHKSKSDQAYQERVAIVDLTAPFCAALGLVGTLVFDPLKAMLSMFHVEKGQYLLSALASSRKSFQNLNYIFRFMKPEIDAGSSYKGLEKLVRDGEASEAIKQLYASKKRRFVNGWLGMIVAGANIFEPLGHLFHYAYEDNKLYKFLFDVLTQFNDDYFLRFFSVRRRCMGEEAFLRAYVEQKKCDSNGIHVQIKDFEALPDTYEQISEHAKNRMQYIPRKQGLFTPVADRVHGLMDRMSLDTYKLETA